MRMGRQLAVVNAPEYWENPVKPLNFEAWKAMYPPATHGFWQLLHRKNGLLIAETWVKNKLTNKGVQACLKNTFAASGGTVSPYKYIAITNLDGVTALTSALTSGQVYTSLSVDALTGTIPSGATIIIGAGTAQTQTVTTSAQASSGATSISVNSFTANANYAIGATVSPQPAASDDPTSLGTLTSYSTALSSGDFTYGTHDVSFGFTFAFNSATPGTYTGAYVANTSPVNGSGQTAVHITFDGRKTFGSSDTFTLNISETITPS